MLQGDGAILGKVECSIRAGAGIVSIVQSHDPTNRTKLEAKEEFFEQLKAVIDNSQDTQARHNHRHG